MPTVVLDTMGSDHGAGVLVEGACMLSLDSSTDIVLVGQEELLHNSLKRHSHHKGQIHIVNAPKYISMDDDPKKIVRDSSLYIAAELVQKGKGEALVSAGNTGAVVMCALRTFQHLHGIPKVALAAVYPTKKTHGPRKDPFALLLDVGATLHVRAEDLVGFALMGSVYARIISDNPSPKVALLSNGAEPKKGAPEVVRAHALLHNQKEICFVGNVEGIDIPKGSSDVVVCEGFLGNVVLKMIEGVGEVASTLIRSVSIKTGKNWDPVLYKAVERFTSLPDWKQYGGAPILGLDKVVIKAHGRSTARAVRNALKLANRAVERDMIEKIQEGITRVLS